MFNSCEVCFLDSQTKSDFIRAKYQFLAFVNKHKDMDGNSTEDICKVEYCIISYLRRI